MKSNNLTRIKQNKTNNNEQHQQHKKGCFSCLLLFKLFDISVCCLNKVVGGLVEKTAAGAVSSLGGCC